MGCKNSKIVNELYNKDVSVKRKFQSGIHISKGADGIEGGFQIAFGTIKKRVYERIPTTITEEEQQQQQHAIEE